jgi:4-amino-4-deoxy-L-arabinose transferase-like glycosyltransferase
MLTKALMYVSLQAAQAWNADAAQKISDEAALRFPNVLFGALTVLPIFLLMAAFFDRRTALIAAALWAFGINAITYNRISKEDTLLVFFLLFAFYFYIRAKQTSNFEAKTRRLYYGLSGASFGLMLASKYFPHFLGLNMLYHHLFHVRESEPNEPQGKTPLGFFFIIMGIFFLIANPTVLLPQVWQYLNVWSSGQMITHTGYLVGEQLYKNTMKATPFWGTPLYFYLLFLAVKLPIPVVISLVAGLVQCVRRWRHPGYIFLLFMFAFWIVPFSLIGGKWLRYTLTLLPFVYMIAAVGIVALIEQATRLLQRLNIKRAAALATIPLLLVMLALPAWTAYASGPHYAAYTNLFGGGRTGYFFPHDEFYDDRLREALRFIAENAPPNASVAHETPAATRYYLEQYGRTDLTSHSISDPQFKLEEAGRPLYVIVQRGRTYFENRDKVKEVRMRGAKVYEGFVNGVTAVEVYKL